MVLYAKEGLFKVYFKDKWGLIDTVGKEILPVENRFIPDFNCGYSLIEGPLEKRFFISSKGERLKISENFNLRENFSENLAVVKENENFNGKYGYINSKGKMVIPFSYDYAASFRNGFAYIKKGKKIGFIDKTGKEILPAIYDNGMFNPQYKVFIVALEKKYGVIDSTGKKVIPFEYEEIQSYKNGRAVVVNNKKYGVVDTSGKEIIPLQYERILDLDNYYNIIQNGKSGLTDFNGNIIVQCEYDLISGFKSNRAYIDQNKLKGYIDRAGKLIIPCSYEYEYNFRNSTAWVQKNHKYGLIDTIGNIIIPFKYDGIFEFQLDASESSVRYITNYVQNDLTMTQIFKKKYFVRKYKHPICSDDRYFLRRYFSRIVHEWNGYVSRDGIEYFEDK